MPAKRDEIDLRNLRETLQTGGWALIQMRFLDMLEAERLKCERPSSDVMFHQGFTAGLRAVLKVPEILEQEIKREAGV